MNAFTRSWKITQLTFRVINQDRELIWFALLSFLFSTLFAIAMIVPSVVPTIMAEGISQDSLQIFQYIIIFLTYFGLAFIATFFNVCVVYTTKIRFEGGNATFGESMRFAFTKLGLIFQWSLLSATVGLLLKILDNLASRLGKGGQIIASILIGLLGMAWSVISIFVVPVLVYEGLGPIDAVKKSTQVIKKTWGESLIRHFGLGLIQFLVFVIIIALSFGLTYVLTNTFDVIGLAIGIGVGILLMLLTGLIFSVANTIFNTALYVYANKSLVAEGFDEETVKGAFINKR
ncbi:MAG: glycerophosphoryl diester phosphodiesterase membrane domain-containing protein [Cyclobacteriaceae bacterium]|nr:glycerophosphoryl diester phosphodiesterase membrane domain-containing protein [Cyclobacteriaceae bacterium]